MTLQTSVTGKPRDPAFDAYRGLAIVLVVSGHATGAGFAFLHAEHGEWNYYFSLFLRQIQVGANPVFLMVSGYLVGSAMIASWADYTAFLRKRLPRILIPYLVWSVLLTAAYGALGRPFSVLNFGLRLLVGGVDGPFYFIPILTQFYLLMPLFTFLADKRYALWILIPIQLGFLGILHVLRFWVFTADAYFGLPVFMFHGTPCVRWLAFFFLGVQFRRCGAPAIERVGSRSLMAMVVCLLAVEFLEAALLVRFGHAETATSSMRFTAFGFGLALVLLLYQLRRVHWPGVFSFLGEYAFGIFFTHMLLLRAVEYGLRRVHALYMIQPAYQLIAVVVVTVAACVIVYATRKALGAPFARKYLGF